MIETVKTELIECIISRDEMRRMIYNNEIQKDKFVLISIGEPGEIYKHTILRPDEIHGFKDVLQIEFWDVLEDRENYKMITDEQGKIIQDFILKNINETFVIHCAAGISRSAGVGKAVECLKYFGAGDDAKYEYQTCFSSKIDEHKRYSPNLTVFNKIIKKY